MEAMGHYANYVYSELCTVQSFKDPRLIGAPVIVLYLEMNPKLPAAERKMISVDNARALHTDLGRLLKQFDCPNGFTPSEDWTPE